MSRVLRLVPWPAARAPSDPADDERLVAALRRGEPSAAAALVERHGDHVRRVLLRVLGPDDDERGDLLQEVLARAWQGLGRLGEPRALRAWLTNIAVFTAREAIRRRRRRRWLVFGRDPPEPEAAWADPELREAARAVYAIFERMPLDERIPFALRALEGMELEAIAGACALSLATLRRRLARADRRFRKLARSYEALAPWLGDPAEP